MYKNFYILGLCFICSAFFVFNFLNIAQAKEAICQRELPPPEVNLVLDFGRVIYTPASNISNPHVGEININMFASKDSWKEKDKFCLSLRKVDLILTMGEYRVLIDRKYKRGSCEYDAIKSFESDKIYFIRNFMKLYRGRILEQVKEYAKTFETVSAGSKEQRDKESKTMTEKLQKYVASLDIDFNKALYKALYDNDSLEKINEMIAKCKNW